MFSTSKNLRLNLALTALIVCINLSGTAKADVVVDWNQVTLATQASVSGAIRTPPASRALAMVHAAIYDSVNAIDRRYSVYAVDAQPAPGASAEAAVAAAAHAVLVSLYPSRQANLDAAYASSLSLIPNGLSKTDGISLGESVAAAILALRSSDGSTTTLPYTQPPGPGIWQPTPLTFAPALFVAWGNVTPFTLTSGSQFRAEGPPALTSVEYAADFNDVKSLGAANSATRTPGQTETAYFWAENSQITWNHIAATVAAARHNSLLDNARLFALLNLAGADTAITVFDSKYAYHFWRPITAIRSADNDGNDDTIADPTWLPLVETPAHPDYTSQHSAMGAAAAKVLASFFGSDEIPFSITTSTAPGGVVRSYTSFSQAAEENMVSRIYIGYHFRSACRHGFNQGSQVAHWVFHKYLQPIGPGQ
jgi:PAP2 superfamily